MLLKHLPAAAVLVLSAASARADFSYEQTSKITGGMMAGMMKFAGAFSKQAREPIQTTISVKGDRLSSASAHHINIIDLNAETITDVDLDKKTYAVITFAEMARAMQQMSEKMGDKTGDASLNAKANVKQTGSTRNINGFQTKESVLTIELEGQNNKSGEKGSMTVVTDMWLAPNLPGYDEVKDFYARMGKKLAWTPGMGGMGAMMGRQAGMMKGMSQLYQEASKLEGVPVLQIVRMSGMANGMSEADMAKMQEAQAQAQAEQQQNPPPPAPTAGEVAGNAASGAALGRMGKLGGLAGAAGGFGGFGRKKKQQQEEAPPQQSQPQQAQTPPPAQAAQTPPNGMGPTPPGTLIEMTTELTAFSSAPVDSAKMNVPDGFKQVDHEMKKALK
jgi:carbon monoxide dehydrogenase subunit G